MHDTPLLSQDHGSETYQPASISNQVQLSNVPPTYTQSQLHLPVQHVHPAHDRSINQSINNPSNQSINMSAVSNHSSVVRPAARPFMMSPYQQSSDPVRARLMPGQPGHFEIDGDWHDGLSDCLNGPMICLMTFCCPCYQWPATVAKLGYLSVIMGLIYVICALLFYTQVPGIVFATALFGGIVSSNLNDFVTLVVGLGVLFGAIVALICAYYREKIREKYQIDGSFLGDFCIYFWCSCCAIAQEARHVDYDYGLLV